MITIATFVNRAQAQGWTQLDRIHHGEGIIGITFKQDGIIMTGTFFPATVIEQLQGFSVTLSDRDTGNFACLGLYEDHTNTDFSLAWTLIKLYPILDDEYATCDCDYCRPDLYPVEEDYTYEPLHPYERYDPELAP